MKDKKEIIITGGEFFNKGAQAMSYMTIDRIKKEFPQHQLLFASDLDMKRATSEKAKYNFEMINNPYRRGPYPGENIVRKMLGKKLVSKKVKRDLTNIEYLFDISGYALSTQGGKKGWKKTKHLLAEHEKALDHGTKVVIMPQSIGPFFYQDEASSAVVRKAVKKVLSKVNVLFVREKQGLAELQEQVGIKHAIYSPDLVLTNRQKLDMNHIYRDGEPQLKTYKVKENAVAIVPNRRNNKNGNEAENLVAYSMIINKLLDHQKEVYIISHSADDVAMCQKVAQAYTENPKVHLITADLTPNEFEKLISQFEFAIASRFHSIVHAYKEGVPCVLMGWAVKYHELATLFNQDAYVVDVRSADISEQLSSAVIKMLDHVETERDTIKHVLTTHQYADPFDIAFKALKQSSSQR